jgi:hypothetical protein
MYQDNLYPEEQRFKYPKAGEVNSIVSLLVYDIASGTTRTIPTTMEYIPRLGWTSSDDVLWFMRMDRLQRTKEIATVDLTQRSTDPIPTVVYKETSDTYVEVTDDLHFLGDGSGFVLTSEKNGWNHVYFVPMSGSPRTITTGDWDVVEVKGIEEQPLGPGSVERGTRWQRPAAAIPTWRAQRCRVQHGDALLHQHAQYPERPAYHYAARRQWKGGEDLEGQRPPAPVGGRIRHGAA